MRTLLVNSSRLMNITQGREKSAATIMYATAFASLIKSGTICRREYGTDGLSRIVINVGTAEYKCPELLLEKLLKNTYDINPYQDNTKNYYKIEETKALSQIELTNAELERRNENSKNLTEIISDIASNLTSDELPDIELTEEKQAEILLEETGYYKIGALLNVGLAIACIALSIFVFVF